MSRLALAVFVVAALMAELQTSDWGLDGAPWMRIAQAAPEASTLRQTASFDPFATPVGMQPAAGSVEHRLAWSRDNSTLEAILGSAIWRASADCAMEGACVLREATTLRPL